MEPAPLRPVASTLLGAPAASRAEGVATRVLAAGGAVLLLLVLSSGVLLAQAVRIQRDLRIR
jgi:hypothetical protein